jgi:hypothetical protein
MVLHDAAALAVATSPEISNRTRDAEVFYQCLVAILYYSEVIRFVFETFWIC